MMRRFVLKKEAAPTGAPDLSALTLDYAAALNPQQLAAATAGKGPILIVAGAGTGKTRTLVYRVAYLLETGTPPEAVLLLTFTRRAARSMLDRVGVLLDQRAQRVQGGTFHAVCLHLLRRHANRLGFPNGFTLLDTDDAADVLDLLRTERGLHQSAKRFPQKRTLHAMLSAAANRDLALDQIVEADYPQFLGHLDEIEGLRDAFAAYKRQHGLMDYDDLLLHTDRLLTEHDDVRRTVAGGFQQVLVDEYQDTNRLQARLVRHFASVHGNVTAVGDDAQSIYRFRGADFRNILDFPQVFPGTRILKLEQNYRSTQPILDLANHVLVQAREKYSKHLFTEKPDGERAALIQAPDESWESRFVCQVVLDRREQGLPLNRMAVLFRSSHTSYDLEAELSRRRIPYVKYGGLKLGEAAHVKDLVAHLRVVENPGDVVAWNRILKLIEGIGPKTAKQFVEWIGTAQDPLALDAPYTSPAYLGGIRALAALLQALRASEAPLPVQLEALLTYYRPLMERLYPDDHEKRTQDLDHVTALAQTHGRRADFLETLALDPIDLTALDAEASLKDEPPLILSTIHSAKGLEFDTVFLIQALDGILPSQYALKTDEEVDEELRLLYVALTRAEQHLFISYPIVQHRRRTGDYFSNPSRFLSGVPDHLLEPWSLVEDDETPPALAAPEDRSLLGPAGS